MNGKTMGTRPEAAAGAVSAMSATTGHGEETLLILDKGGNIEFCGTPGFFGYGGDNTHSDMGALSIRKLIPGLALRRNTPGYNMAYVNFWFGDNAWQSFEGRSADGRSFDVELRLQVTRIQNKHWLLAHVRHPAAQPCAAPEAPPTSQPLLSLVAMAA